VSEGERLQKVLARAGFGSRRACEELIAAGRVQVNGDTAVLGRRVEIEHDKVSVEGLPVAIRSDLVYYLLNKPVRVVTTAHDPEGRPTVLDLVPSEPRVFPVGRLDYTSEGLLVLTNDGEFANLLAHPSHGVDKTYLVEVDGNPGPSVVNQLARGVDLDDGRTAPARVQVSATRADSSALEFVLHEGRNRQIRRMCDAVGFPVRRLVRTRIGPLSDPRLQPGEWRSVLAREVRALVAAASEPREIAADPKLT
jgi:23S rRNA pseudouridine2605 synthase